jgi:RNA-directed DNA polymerase
LKQDLPGNPGRAEPEEVRVNDSYRRWQLKTQNLNEAFKQVKRKKGAGGVDGMQVDDLLPYLKKHGTEILQSLQDGKYRPKPVRRVEIRKENGKVRKLGIPTVVDRMIQQAISQVLTPIYEEQFSDNLDSGREEAPMMH